jgi:signal transduction histidine kinase
MLTMSEVIHSLRRIPVWAYLLVIFVITVNSVYLYYRHQIANDGAGSKIENGQCVITRVQAGSPAAKAGLQTGDILVSIDSIPITGYPHLSYLLYVCQAGDQLTYRISRNNIEFSVPVVLRSILSEVPGFFQGMYALILIIIIASLYLLYKKTGDPSATIFFIYIQLFAITENGRMLLLHDPLASVVSVAWMLGGCLLGPVLINFHLLFPRKAAIYVKLKRLPVVFYVTGFLLSSCYALSYILNIYAEDDGFYNNLFMLLDRLVVTWMTLTFAIALAVVVYQYRTIKNTLARNQLQLVLIGSFFGFLTPMTITFFKGFVHQMQSMYPVAIDFVHGICSFIMVICILIAIFRYRIWDMEIIIRKVILYLFATAVIILSYLFMVWIVAQFISGESNLTRFVILAISVILFLVLRDHIQRLIDRLFHRETYDSATVVSDFEAKLAGIYRFDELKQKIVQSIDEIFHLKSFVFNLKKRDKVYEPVFVYGTNKPVTGSEYEINPELEEKLKKSKVFSPEELNKKPPILEDANGELVVPLISEGRPNGFFICGQKKSERIFSRQDIQVLSLLGRRVIALLHTASLYQKDLDRQVMLERERTRISQDMHDDVGASLTRIAILSELAKNNTEITGETRQWLGQISDTSRGVVEEMSQIIWALNPKNDTLEGLITYIRRFVGEYLEPTPVQCSFEFPESLPRLQLSVEVRRNIYLVVREALHNVVKHSGATKVTIGLTLRSPLALKDLTPQPPLPRERGRRDMKPLTSNQFIIIIRDNGKGFDPEKPELPGNGLINMRKRMRDIGGSIHIRSEVGAGTEILLIGDAKPNADFVS